MTVFYREGHWRDSPNGGIHWVEGHLVERNYWDRGSQAVNLYDWSRDSTEPGCWPTLCPKCGALVYFVRHNGGSVWLDALGPPWPKHPCFDEPLLFDPEIRHGKWGRWTLGVVSAVNLMGDGARGIEIDCGFLGLVRGFVSAESRSVAVVVGDLVMVYREGPLAAAATFFLLGSDSKSPAQIDVMLFQPGGA